MPLEALVFHLAAASIRALVPAALAFLLLWGFRRQRHASFAHAVWTVVLLGMLAMPFLSPMVPGFSLRLLPPELPRPVLVAAGAALPGASISGIDHSAVTIAPRQTSARSSLPGGWLFWIGGVYLVGVCALLARLGIGCLLTWKLLRESKPLDDPEVHELFVGVAAHWKLPRLPSLRESRCVKVPVTAGWLYPRILLPAGWRAWSKWKLRAVLAHELSHTRRGDRITSLAAALNTCLFWFHPLAWWLERKLSILAEHASDSASLNAAGDPPAYAQLLLDMAAAVASDGGRFAWQPQAIAGCSRLGRRIDRILGQRHADAAWLSRANWAVITLCAVPLIYTAAAAQLERPQGQPNDGLLNPMELLINGWNLKPADVQRLEEHLKIDPEDENSRALLLSYYFQNAIRHPRVEHIFWLIENHPDSRLFETRVAGFSAVKNNPLNTGADLAVAKTLWLRQIERYPESEPVLRHGLSFLVPYDLPLAEELIENARRSRQGRQEWTARLAYFYAHVISSAETIEAGDVAFNPWADPAFVSHAREVLETSKDPLLVGLAGERLAEGLETVRGDPLIDTREVAVLRRRAAIGEMLLRRASALDPTNPRWAERLKRLENAGK